MKTTRGARNAVLAGSIALSAWTSATADDVAPKPAPADPVTSVKIVAPKLSDPAPSPPKTLQPIKDPAVVAAKADPAVPAPLVGEPPMTVIANSAGLDTLRLPTDRPQADVQRRLEAPSPEKLIERYGTVGFLYKQPEPRNFVEVINPFAPTDFGPGVREIYNRDRNLKPGAALPRTFINDVNHEPILDLISWPW